MKIGLFGHGKMGKMVEHAALKKNCSIVSLDQADVFIDFSHADAVLDNVHLAVKTRTPIVIGTTGWDAHFDKVKHLIEKSETAALAAPNFLLGMAHFIHILQYARERLTGYECAGVEFHHSQKKDAPSGTAKKIAHAIGLKTPFTSVRCGNIAGKHTVIFDSPFDSITFTHEARGSEGFASGAIEAASWILDKRGWYTLDDMFRSLSSNNHPI